MLGETWNQVAEWGVETIKNIQTHVGLADEDRDKAPNASKGRRSVRLMVGEVEGSTQIAPIKARQDTGVTSAQVAVLKAQRDELTKSRRANQAKIAKLSAELAAAHVHGHENDSTRVKALKARLHDLRNSADEQTWNGVDGMLEEVMAAIVYTVSSTIRKPAPESQRSDKGDMQSPRRPSASTRPTGSFKGRRSTGETNFKGSSSSPNRAASTSPLASSIHLPKKMEVAPVKPARLPSPPRSSAWASSCSQKVGGHDVLDPPRSRTGKILHTDAFISSLGSSGSALATRRYPCVEGSLRSASPERKSCSSPGRKSRPNKLLPV